MDDNMFGVRYNIINVTSILTFANIKGGMNGSCKDVYFVRCIGCSKQFVSDIAKADELLSVREARGQGKYNRVGKLPRLTEPEDIKRYSCIYEKWLRSEGRELPLEHLADSKMDTHLASKLASEISGLLKNSSQHVSESILKNFIIKVFYWFEYFLREIPGNWNGRESYKLIYSGEIKKQEYLFLYFLTKLGMDVMILSPEKELELEDHLLKLSYKLQLPEFSKPAIPGYDKSAYGESAYHHKIIEGADKQPKLMEPAKTAPVNRTSQNVTVSGRAVKKPKEEKDFEEIAKMASSVVMIAIHDRNGEVIGTGSGIMISREGYILTNNHVTRGGISFSVRTEDDSRIYQTDEIIKYNSLLDLALIRVNHRLAPIPVYRGDKELVRGQKVIAIGSPLGMFNSVSDGIISGFRDIDGVDMIQFTAPISPGSSGGAVLNLFGEVIGISTAGFDNGQNINLAVHYRDINNFIRGFM